jgi:hypothetical protein
MLLGGETRNAYQILKRKPFVKRFMGGTGVNGSAAC